MSFGFWIAEKKFFEYTKYIKSKHFNTVNDLLNYLSSINIENSYIYIKGSRKYKLEIITSILNK